MTILVDSGSHGMRNAGDIAMLLAAVGRLSKLWPNALIEVVTSAPEALERYCPQARAVLSRGRRLWCSRPSPVDAPGGLSGSMAGRFRALLGELRCRLVYGRDLCGDFAAALSRADIVIAAGGGYIADPFEGDALRALEVLEFAAQCGKPTAMFGQGIGPLKTPKLLAKARTVLPLADFIAVRESRSGPAILESLGVAADNVMTTGDDAIETAYESRSAKLGRELGVNFRSATYAEASEGQIETIRNVLGAAAEKYGAQVVAVPVLLRGKNSDIASLERLLTGQQITAESRGIAHPLEVIKRIGLCRAVVTGSYHAAVFALAQGIPAVGLANSEYSRERFLGLAGQFGCGCEVVLLDGGDLREKLGDSIERAYESAERLHSPLLEAATRQIALGRLAYQRVHDMFERRRTEGRTTRSTP